MRFIIIFSKYICHNILPLITTTITLRRVTMVRVIIKVTDRRWVWKVLPLANNNYQIITTLILIIIFK